MPTKNPSATDGTCRVVGTAGGPLTVGVVAPSGPAERTFVVAMGYAASIEQFELQRFRLLAECLASRLVVVETPGCGNPRSALTGAERWALLVRSDVEAAGARMLDAAVAMVPDLLDAPRRGGRLGVIGYSLGASTGTAIARAVLARTGAPVDALVLVEPVAAQRWSPRALLAATREEDGLVDRALAENASVPGAVEPWDRRADGVAPHRNRLDMLLLSAALRNGRLPEQVAAARARHVVVVHGKDSRLSLPQACTAVVEHARAAGSAVAELAMDGTHALWHSLPSVRRLAGFVAEALGGTS